MGGGQGDEILDPTKIRASTLATVQQDLARRLRHTDGQSMTLAESIEDGRVVGKSIVAQGSRNAYAVVVPDTTTDPTVRNEAHVQVRMATWEPGRPWKVQRSRTTVRSTLRPHRPSARSP